MTMKDDKCDVCGINKPVGVGSTLLPYSCAYCIECLDKHAQPLVVFLTWEESGMKPDNDLSNMVMTFDGGRYTSYTEWWNGRHSIYNNVSKPQSEGDVQAKPGLPGGDGG